MLNTIPSYVAFVFGLITIGTLILFSLSIKNSSFQTKSKIIFGLVLWLIIQGFLSLKNTYSLDINSLPPKIVLFGILPPIFLIITLFSTKKGRQFIDRLSLIHLTYLNIIRIPVELVLYWLFLNKVVPELMTFDGRNFDIFAGITAPIVAYFGVTKKKISRKMILVWNFISLALLLNIVTNAFLSAPSPIQQFAFEQPNIAILYFPFSWLPTFIVPVVLFGHFVSIRKLLWNMR